MYKVIFLLEDGTQLEEELPSIPPHRMEVYHGATYLGSVRYTKMDLSTMTVRVSLHKF